ncbi:MAG TPA: hypothetical protein VIH99_02505 [Bdellovibrionota bacterium]|jgi:hypothetical protein
MQKSELQEFLEAERLSPPVVLSEAVRSKIFVKLQPPFWQVLGKLAFIQTLAGALSLAYCPQFGMAFSRSHGLMHYLMQYGKSVCMLGCGALFVGVSLLAASLVLRPEEVRALRERRLLQITATVGLSLGAFVCFGAEVMEAMTLAWALGATLGGMATLELGWSIRRFTYGKR